MTSATGQAPLTAERIVEVALDLIRRHGLDRFSMRKLAAELGVNPMTVYLRFADKDALLDAVARRAASEAATPPAPPDGPWEDRAVAVAAAVRDHLVADRNVLDLYAATDRLATGLVDTVDTGLALVEEIGLHGPAAVRAWRALFWHAVGFALVERAGDPFPANTPGGVEALLGAEVDARPTLARNLEHFRPVDADDLFEHTTRALVAGLRAAASAPRAPEGTR